MEFPFGHSHHHHHQRNDGEDDRQTFGPPPPRNNFVDAPTPPGVYNSQPQFDPYAPPPPAPYRSESQFESYAPPPGRNFEAPSPPPQYGHVSHVGHHHNSNDPYAPPSGPYSEAPSPPPPFGHVSHVSHHHNSNDSYAPPPPAPYRSESQFESNAPPQEPYFEVPPPPPQFGHVSHVGHHHNSNEPYPPNQSYGGHPPPDSTLESHGNHTDVSHVSHHTSHHPHMPSWIHHRPDENRLPDNLTGLAGRPTVKVYSKAEPNYYLTIRDGKVILTPSNPSDEAQHWYKDEKYSTKVKDAEGHPCFALVNKATGEAMKHSVGATHPVHLIRYDPDKLDESVLWTESRDLGDGYRTIRMVNNVRLNVDAFHGDEKSGGVRDGTSIVLWDWNKGDNQRWKIFPF